MNKFQKALSVFLSINLIFSNLSFASFFQQPNAKSLSVNKNNLSTRSSSHVDLEPRVKYEITDNVVEVADIENLGLPLGNLRSINHSFFPQFADATPAVKTKLLELFQKPKKRKQAVLKLREPVQNIIQTFEDVNSLNQLSTDLREIFEIEKNFVLQLKELRRNKYTRDSWQGRHLPKSKKPYGESVHSLFILIDMLHKMQRLFEKIPPHSSYFQYLHSKINKAFDHESLQIILDYPELIQVVSENQNPYLFVEQETLEKMLPKFEYGFGSYDYVSESDDDYQLDRYRYFNHYEKIQEAIQLRKKLSSNHDMDRLAEEFQVIEDKFQDLGTLYYPQNDPSDELVERPYDYSTDKWDYPERGVSFFYRHNYIRQFATKVLKEVFVDFDFYIRTARMIIEDGYLFPKITDEKSVFKGTKILNPLLVGNKRKNVIPFDVSLNSHQNSFLITGPNMGGKTAASRAIGVTALLNQIGMPVPAENVEMSVFDNIYTLFPSAEQVQPGFGYFETLLKELVRLTQIAGPNDLVILDEVPSGTEYYELSAIAVVLLEDLIKTGALVVATSHLKKAIELLQERTGQNVFQFDIEEVEGGFRPNYILKEGVADRSYGIERTKDSGFPSQVTQLAEAYYEFIISDAKKFSPPAVSSDFNNEEEEDNSPITTQDALSVILGKLFPSEYFAFDFSWERTSNTQHRIFHLITEQSYYKENMLYFDIESKGDKSLRGFSNIFNYGHYLEMMKPQARMGLVELFKEAGEEYLIELHEKLKSSKEFLNTNFNDREYSKYSFPVINREILKFEAFLSEWIDYLKSQESSSEIKDIRAVLKVLLDKAVPLMREKFKDEELEKEAADGLLRQWKMDFEGMLNQTALMLSILDEIGAIARAKGKWDLKNPIFLSEKKVIFYNMRPFSLKQEENVEDEEDSWFLSQKQKDLPSPFIENGKRQSFDISDDTSTLVLFGPNSSGKTVAMTSALVNAKLALEGFPVAGDIEIGNYDEIFAIFGGETNMHSDESYFLNILNKYGSVLKRATSNSLVILDELHGTDNFEMAAIQLAVFHYLSDLGATVIYNTHIRDGINELKDSLKLATWKTDIQFINATGEIDYHYTLSPDPNLEAKSYGRAVARKWLTVDQVIRVEKIYRDLIQDDIELETDLLVSA